MRKLIEYTKVLRSKNAGPLYLTLDLIFHDSSEMEYVLSNLKTEDVAHPGEDMMVKVIEIKGDRIRASRKAVLLEAQGIEWKPEDTARPAPRPRSERSGDGEHRGERRDRSHDGDRRSEKRRPRRDED